MNPSDRVDFRRINARISVMPTVKEIIKEHRAAAKVQREILKDPVEARKFLIRAGILTKDGRRLAKRYR